MVQFKAIVKGVEVNKQTVLAFVNSMEQGKENRAKVLLDHNIDLKSTQEWFLQQDWLDAFKFISESLGEMNLFLIGKAIINNAQFPPIDDLEDAFNSLDIAYHMNHRLDGKVMYDATTNKISEGIGHYNLTKFDAEKRTAEIVCNNPYPSKFDEGIITQLTRMFKPSRTREFVKLDTSKETRIRGADSCTYLIEW